LAEAVTVLLNSAMVAERSEHLGVAPYDRSAQQVSYVNRYIERRVSRPVVSAVVAAARETLFANE